MVTGFDSAATNVQDSVPCPQIRAIDNKIDDGMVNGGNIITHWSCESANTCNAQYSQAKTNGRMYYNAKF